MAPIWNKIFGRKVEPQPAPQPPQAETQQYEKEYVTYCIEQEQTVSALEAGLHESDDPNEIAMQTLKTTCEFYGAEWAGIIEGDFDIGIWTFGWRYSTNPNSAKIRNLPEYENTQVMPSWIDSMKRNQPIVILDTNTLIKSAPQEYQLYKRLGAKSIMAVPFGPNPVGFLAIKNPTRYQTRTSTLNILAYVMHRAMAQRDTMERAKMILTPENIQSDKDIIINFFGDLSITTEDGVWKEHEFNSTKSSRVIAYILLNRKTAHSALAIADALYPEETADVDTINKNIRGYIYRFRKSFELISKYKLIEYSTSGYRLNPVLNVKSDLQQFENLWEYAQQDIPAMQKRDILKNAVALYKGAVFASASSDHWLVGIATEYKMKYIGMVNELLEIMAEYQDYDGVHHYALQSLKLVPENVKAQYWLIYSMHQSGAVALAKQEMRQAKLRLTAEEYETLKGFIKKARRKILCKHFSTKSRISRFQCA